MTFGEFINFFNLHVVTKPPEPVEINAQIYISVLDNFFVNAGGHKNKTLKEYRITIFLPQSSSNQRLKIMIITCSLELQP